MSAEPPRSLRDVVTLLREHHQVVTAALLDVLGETGSGREASFARLERVLSVHEALEQVVVHQRPEVQADAGARVAEETELSKAITHLEAIGAPSDHFRSAFGGLRLAVEAHLQHEEVEELPQLAGDLSDQQRAQVGVAVMLGCSPHPTGEAWWRARPTPRCSTAPRSRSRRQWPLTRREPRVARVCGAGSGRAVGANGTNKQGSHP